MVGLSTTCTEYRPDVTITTSDSGLGTLTASQRALADFRRLDGDLVAIAARPPPLEQATGDPDELVAWTTRLPVTRKDSLLTRVAAGRAIRVRMDLQRRFRYPIEHARAERLDAGRTVILPARFEPGPDRRFRLGPYAATEITCDRSPSGCGDGA